MELTAREATILTLLSSRPSTQFFEELVHRLGRPDLQPLVEKIRQRAETEALTTQG
jgi:ATP-dependent RNA circularization protein (DNA/RNA ligase family)